MLAAHMEIWGRLYADIFSCVRFLILLTPGWDAKAAMRAVWTGCSCQDARSTEGSPTATKWHGAITMQHWKVSCQKNETSQLISLNTGKGSVTVSLLQHCIIWYCWTHGWDWTRHWRIPADQTFISNSYPQMCQRRCVQNVASLIGITMHESKYVSAIHDPDYRWSHCPFEGSNPPSQDSQLRFRIRMK